MQLWTADGVCTHTLAHPNERLSSVTFSPDSQIFASWSVEGTVCVWDVDTGSRLQTLKLGGRHFLRLVFSSDGNTLAAEDIGMKTLQLWDLATGSSKHSFQGFSIRDVDFSPDGKFLAALSSRKVLLLETETAFSPDSKILASSSVDGISLWDTATGTCTQTSKLEGLITELSFSDDGKFLLTNVGRLTLDNGSVSPLLLTSDDWLAIDGLRYDGEWVSREGKNLLYIPAGKRPTHRSTWRMFKNTLFIGDAFGQVTCYMFSFPSS
ncbi:hypothetical protein Asppvi_010742 [Aspergillus pseudoviridinutans]|uniref:WD40 repeat-like protein n=1 Tax=Aspergillus pseudoviridinutans TaxID=1517512 RepID=A0A9P3BPZ5_9EURO|nr:uncharacterized protein Asppvi_010742 [Aspergillus pseudoviridinutans]GIJ91769.1 hypothetical protein Asppvi_010742 [Aspergillus pseudoviridinutans]